MIEFKVKAKNCNRGQLFRHCWVSSAWISKEWCTCNKLIDWSSIPAQFGLYHVVAPLSFLRSISLAALFLVYKKGKAREISKVNCNYQLSFIYLIIITYLLLFNLYICIYPVPKFRSCHKAIMVTTGRAHCIHNCILRSLSIQFEHSLDWVESLVKGVHYWHIASLTACSLSTLVIPQCNLTMCNRTSCAQVQELP